jgi:hypothetical protein
LKEAAPPAIPRPFPHSLLFLPLPLKFALEDLLVMSVGSSERAESPGGDIVG